MPLYCYGGAWARKVRGLRSRGAWGRGGVESLAARREPEGALRETVVAARSLLLVVPSCGGDYLGK